VTPRTGQAMPDETRGQCAEQAWARSEELVFREIDGELTILPFSSGVGDAEEGFYTLSETGRAVWESLDGVKTLGGITEELVARFDAPREEIERDVATFVAELSRRKLIVPVSPQAAAETRSYLTGLLNATLARNVPFRFKAEGCSMHPFIQGGDAVTVSPLRGKPGCGDVVAFRRFGAEQVVIHRVVGVRDEGLLIKGDNSAWDGLIPASQVLGRVTRVERGGRRRRFGLGAERRVIAFCSRTGLLPVLLRPVRKLYRLFGPRVRRK